MRYRLYSTFGLSAVEIVKVIAFCTSTFVLGFCTLAGALFVFKPLPLPSIGIELPFKTVFPIGVALLGCVAIYLFESAFRRRGVTVRGWELSLPSVYFTVPQIFFATADLIAAAGVLYVLLPASIDVSFYEFLGVFLLRAILGNRQPRPRRIGSGRSGVAADARLPPTSRRLMASMVAYRLTYYLAPLAIAVAMLAIHEGFRQRTAVAGLPTCSAVGDHSSCLRCWP